MNNQSAATHIHKTCPKCHGCIYECEHRSKWLSLSTVSIHNTPKTKGTNLTRNTLMAKNNMSNSKSTGMMAKDFVKAYMLAYRRGQTMVDLGEVIGMSRFAVYQRKKIYQERGVKLPTLRKQTTASRSPRNGGIGRGNKLDVEELNGIVESYLPADDSTRSRV